VTKDIHLFVETQGGGIRKIVRQVVTAARALAEARGGELNAMLIGSGVGDLSSEAARLGVDRVVVVDDPLLATYATEPYATALAGAVDRLGGGTLAIGNTSIGKDVGPRIAQRLGLPMITDVVETEIADASVSFKRPIYAGKALQVIQVLEDDCVVSFRANSFPETPPVDPPVQINKLDVPLDSGRARTIVKEIIKREEGPVDLTEADVIVSGGMGVKGPEGFDFLKQLCEPLGAALGSSRAAVLAGYIHPSHQVGQTGKTVSPSLYIACGISGAIQHKAGMSTSKCIVAINSDPDAPMFEFADYGIVGDLFEVVPHLAEECKKLLQ